MARLRHLCPLTAEKARPTLVHFLPPLLLLLLLLLLAG
jgi:hypothetical protein